MRLRYRVAPFFHQAIVYSIIFPLYKHVRLRNGSVWLLIILGIFLGSNVLRYLLQPSHWIRRPILYVDAAGPRLRICLQGRYTWKVRAGQYIRIWTPRASLLRSYALQILWWGKDEYQNYYVELALPNLSMYRKYREEQLVPNGKTMILEKEQFWLSGPYGASASLQRFQTIFMFAIDTGIASQIPCILELLAERQYRASNIRKINLYWQLTDCELRMG